MKYDENDYATGRQEEEALLPPARTRRQSLALYTKALLRDPTAAFGLGWLVLILVAAISVEFIMPFDSTSQNLRLRNEPPMTPAEGGGLPHLLGTDAVGRDVLTRILEAGRLSLAVGAGGVILSGTIGVLLGLIAGYKGGRIDAAIMRLVDLQLGMPFLMLAIFVLYALGPGFWNVVLVLSLVRWPIFARVTRSMTLSMRQEEFIESARVMGCSTSRILRRHMLPNLLSPILVLATLEIARLILAESALSFLGMGVQPPDTSWGVMVSDGRAYIASAWWLVAMPGLFIFLTALSANLVASWARAVTDPVQRWRWLVAKTKNKAINNNTMEETS